MAQFLGGINSTISWATGNNVYLGGLASNTAMGLSVMGYTVDIDADDIDTSAFSNAGITSAIPGLQSGRFSYRALLFTPIHGNSGLVTYASGYTANINAYNIRISRSEHDVTAYNSTPPTWKTFISGAMRWEGGYSGFHDDTTAIVAPGINTTEPAAATFKIQDLAADNALSGSILTRRVTVQTNFDQPGTVDYDFRGSGNLTQSTPTGPSRPLWAPGALDLTAAGTITLTSTTSRTFSGSAFWTSININHRMGQRIEVEVAGRFTGAITIG